MSEHPQGKASLVRIGHHAAWGWEGRGGLRETTHPSSWASSNGFADTFVNMGWDDDDWSSERGTLVASQKAGSLARRRIRDAPCPVWRRRCRFPSSQGSKNVVGGRWIEQCLTNKYLPEAGTCMLGRGIRIIHGRTLQALDNKHMVRAASSYVYPHQACNGKKGEKAK